VGIADDTVRRAQALVKAGVDVLVVDTAHGHSRNVLEMVNRLKSEFSELEIVAGNVATEAGTAI
jgi:IMP dehydrogenase